MSIAPTPASFLSRHPFAVFVSLMIWTGAIAAGMAWMLNAPEGRAPTIPNTPNAPDGMERATGPQVRAPSVAPHRLDSAGPSSPPTILVPALASPERSALPVPSDPIAEAIGRMPFGTTEPDSAVRRMVPGSPLIPSTVAPERTGQSALKGPPTQGARASALTLVDASLGTGISGRQPEGVGQQFTSDTDQVWAWVKLNNPGAPTRITMIWRQDGRVRSTVDVAVGHSPSWRTWTRHRISDRSRGDWTVEVLDDKSISLGTLAFEIFAPDDAWWTNDET